MDHEIVLAWAETHLESLEKSITGYFEKHPEVLAHEYDHATGEVVVRYRKRHLMEEDIWPLQIGDVVHNIRVSLDYLAFRVVSSRPHQAKTDKIAFPICTDALSYPSIEGRCIGADMPQDFRDEIKSLQPYHAPQALDCEPLAILDEMENVHKHRRLLLAGVRISRIQQIGTSDKIRVTMTTVPASEIEDGAELYRYLVLDPAHTETDVKIKLTSYVLLNEPGLASGRPVLKVLKELTEHVRQRVFPHFKRFL